MNDHYITLNAISKHYSAKNGTVEALKNVSLSIPQNEIFGVIGLSGAGKSTLVRCINLLERPDTGEIIINRENLLNLGSEELRLRRQKIGMIFQHFNLLEQQTVLNKKRQKLIRLSFLADKSSVLPLQESWQTNRIFCSAMKQQARWIRKRRKRSWD